MFLAHCVIFIKSALKPFHFYKMESRFISTVHPAKPAKEW